MTDAGMMTLFFFEERRLFRDHLLFAIVPNILYFVLSSPILSSSFLSLSVFFLRSARVLFSCCSSPAFSSFVLLNVEHQQIRWSYY
jgi:hypothetical protein